MKNLKKIRQLYKKELEDKINIRILRLTDQDMIFEFHINKISKILNFLLLLYSIVNFKYNSHPSRIKDYSGMTFQIIGNMKIEYLMHHLIKIIRQNEEKI